MDDDLFNTTFSVEGDVTTSVLSFVAREDLAAPPVLAFRCVATNDVGNATSDTAMVTIQSKLAVFYVEFELRLSGNGLIMSKPLRYGPA